MPTRNPLNEAVIAQVVEDLRNGQLYRCRALGFGDTEIDALKRPEMAFALANAQIQWCTVAINLHAVINLLKSDYTDSQDNFREDALERDAERLDDVLAILSGEAPEATLERCLRNSGAGLKNNLKSLGFIVRFNAKGDCTVARHETA